MKTKSKAVLIDDLGNEYDQVGGGMAMPLHGNVDNMTNVVTLST